MIALTQITNAEIVAFIAVLAFKLLWREVLFTKWKDNRNLKTKLLFKKVAHFTCKLL